MSISPHSGVGACAPNPKKDRDANSSIMVPISVAAVTTMVVIMLGITYFIIMLPLFVPVTTAASIYRFCLIFRTILRASLAYFVQLTAEMAITAFTIFGPRRPAMAIASTRPGKEIIISAIRMITASTAPPKYPARIPRAVPTTKMTATRHSVMVRDDLVPYITLESTSLPSLSVPQT